MPSPLQSQAIISIPTATKELNLTPPTVTTALQNLEKLDIVREITGRNYGRLYAYTKHLSILNEGTEPLK